LFAALNLVLPIAESIALMSLGQWKATAGADKMVNTAAVATVRLIMGFSCVMHRIGIAQRK
jgi:hypothetical protein